MLSIPERQDRQATNARWERAISRHYSSMTPSSGYSPSIILGSGREMDVLVSTSSLIVTHGVLEI